MIIVDEIVVKIQKIVHKVVQNVVYRKTRKMRNRWGIPQDIKNSSFNEYSLGHTLSASSKTLRNVDRICVQQLSKNSSVDDSRKVTNT